jgi:hypothetical protein
VYDRDALLAAVDLRALADELLGPRTGTGRTPTWPCPNPQHAQTGRTPPLSVFTSRRGEPRWRCHGCGTGGTAIDLITTTQHITVREALDHLARRAGHHPRPDTWTPTPRTERTPVPDRVACTDLTALNAYVDDCARTLWGPAGTPVRRWLTDERRLPAEVLEANRIGADLGRRRQPRPHGMPNVAGAVLPAIEHGDVVYAQIRVPYPWEGGSRYYNAAADLAANPRIARCRPARCLHPELLVTEGHIDGLSAAAAGYRAVSILSAGYPDASVALTLARLAQPLVIVFDPDGPGRAGVEQLITLLHGHQRQPRVIELDSGDLNDTHRNATDWHHELPARVRAAAPARDGPALAR